MIHDIALQKLPVVFCLDRAGLVGEDGATHHGAFDLSYLNLIPDLIIMAPADAGEFKAMMQFAATYKDGPIAIRYPRGSAKRCKNKTAPLEIGKYDVREKGEDIAILGIGKAFEDAEKIFEKIKQDFPKLTPYLINPRFMKPVDNILLKELEKKVKTIFTIEENSLIGGFGDVIKRHFINTQVEVYSFGIPDRFVPHGSTNELKELIEVSTDQIYKKIKDLLK